MKGKNCTRSLFRLAGSGQDASASGEMAEHLGEKLFPGRRQKGNGLCPINLDDAKETVCR